MSPTYTRQNLDHLGLVAGMYDEWDIGRYLDEQIPQDQQRRQVSIGQAVKARVLNGLGFVNRALSLTPQFFADKPTDWLIGPGVRPEPLNDDVLGRALDSLYEHDVTALFSGVGAQAAQRLGLRGSTVPLDSTSFHADGEYAYDAQDGVIEIVPGYRRDHRPELNQAMLNRVVEPRAGRPLLMEPLSGNASDKVSFGELIERPIDQLNTTHGVDDWVADSALYTVENLRTLSAHPGRWISRVPATIARAQHERDALDEPMRALVKGYRYRRVQVEYGGVVQRWRVMVSGPAMKRAGPGIARRLARSGEKERKAYEKRSRQRFACEADARQALAAFQAQLELLMLEEAAVIEAEPGATKPWQVMGLLASDRGVRWAWWWKKSTFIIATNELDADRLPDVEVGTQYRAQQQAERGVRFLKDPRFQANTRFLKSPKRVMALRMVMTVCRVVYAALEYRTRNALAEQRRTVPDQKGRATHRPTMRGVFQFFAGIHRLLIDGQATVMMNLKVAQWTVIEVLGRPYRLIYGGGGGRSGVGG